MSKDSDNSNYGETDRLTLAIFSDLHFYDSVMPYEGNPPSHFDIGDSLDDPKSNPISGLNSLIEENSLLTDIILCPGDIGDKATPAAINSAWNVLENLRIKLGANHLFATTGNHDVDSHYENNSFDPKGFLQTLNPLYPTHDERLNDHYWSRHFAIFEHDSLRLLIVNSSAFHGGGRLGQNEVPEFAHGRISKYTLAAIELSLNTLDPVPFQILLCHHHPHQHSKRELEDTELIYGGRGLLDLLSSGNLGRWLVIHGHRHVGSIENAAGATCAPIVFGAASLCATTSHNGSFARNQFYIMELQKLPSYELCGTFRAWNWHVGIGWIPASASDGLPARGGFGWQGSLIDLANDISEFIGTDEPVKWSNIESNLSQLRFLLPKDLLVLEKRLDTNHGIELLRKGDQIESAGRMIE